MIYLYKGIFYRRARRKVAKGKAKASYVSRKLRYPGWLPASKEAFSKAKEYGIAVRFKPVLYPDIQRIGLSHIHPGDEHKNIHF